MPVTSRPLPRSAPSVVVSMGEETRCSTGVRVAKPRLCESCHVVRPPLPCLTPSPAPILPLRAGRLARAARCAKLLCTRARPCFTIFDRTLEQCTRAHVGSAPVKPRLVPMAHGRAPVHKLCARTGMAVPTKSGREEALPRVQQALRLYDMLLYIGVIAHVDVRCASLRL